jgi:non-ribosomal peptide synthetase component F
MILPKIISSAADGVAISMGVHLVYSVAVLVTHWRSIQYRLPFCKFLPPPVGSLPLIYIQGIDVSPLSTNGFSIAVSYLDEMISESEVTVILDHLETALLFLTNRPHDTVGDVDLINENERQRLVRHISSGDMSSPSQNISELVEAQAARTPEKIAVCVILTCLSNHLLMAYVQLQFGQDVFVTYREMDHLSNDLARTLIVGGVVRGTLVALYMDKSIEMFLSILAIHKAGGGYVPLDPDHPVERTQTIVCLAQPVMVLTTRELHGQLGSALLDTGVRFTLVDFNRLSPSTKPDVGPIGRDDVCHVLFTSGSTGTPKGIDW